MSKGKRRRDPSAFCGQLGSDDCIDPRTYFAPGHNDRRESRKSKQLCRQIEQTLDYVLSGDCRDEVLQSLRVVSVVPAPYSSRLLVTLQSDLPDEQFDPTDILDRIDAHAGRIRAEVASAINRRRTPVLTYQILPRETAD